MCAMEETVKLTANKIYMVYLLRHLRGFSQNEGHLRGLPLLHLIYYG